MQKELSYVVITPYTIAKSRTGGVISRLLSRLDLEFCGAQIFAPSAELAETYANSVRNRKVIAEGERQIANLIGDYIFKTFSPSGGRRHRVMMLLFRGEDVCRKLTEVVGVLHPEDRAFETISGETIRDTYADLIMTKSSPPEVSYCEPAVLTPPRQELAIGNMKLLADFIRNEPNLVENMRYDNPERIERTLVIIKPDNWRFPSSRPGTIIDMFSRTGLRIIGCKLVQMSVAEAVEFYTPVLQTLKDKLAPLSAREAREVLEQHFHLALSDKFEQNLTSSFGHEHAAAQFDRIIEFMSGYKPTNLPKPQWHEPGKVKSMVLVYEGENAIQKIRSVLGPTDPTKAPSGTVRKDFGSDTMVNTAHASDSVSNAKREMQIVAIQKNLLTSQIDEFLNAAVQ